MKGIYFDRTVTTNDEWKQAIRDHAKIATGFEIHCWNTETDIIALAQKFGTDTIADGSQCTVIRGRVTPALLEMLTSQPKPQDTAVYNKMTPFSSIFFNNGFSSEHYGTELYFMADH